MTLRMAPPATSDRAARDGLRNAWDRPSRSLKHDSVKLDECHPLFRAHITPRGADIAFQQEPSALSAETSALTGTQARSARTVRWNCWSGGKVLRDQLIFSKV